MDEELKNFSGAMPAVFTDDLNETIDLTRPPEYNRFCYASKFVGSYPHRPARVHKFFRLQFEFAGGPYLEDPTQVTVQQLKAKIADWNAMSYGVIQYRLVRKLGPLPQEEE